MRAIKFCLPYEMPESLPIHLGCRRVPLAHWHHTARGPLIEESAHGCKRQLFVAATYQAKYEAELARYPRNVQSALGDSRLKALSILR